MPPLNNQVKLLLLCISREGVRDHPVGRSGKEPGPGPGVIEPASGVFVSSVREARLEGQSNAPMRGGKLSSEPQRLRLSIERPSLNPPDPRCRPSPFACSSALHITALSR